MHVDCRSMLTGSHRRCATIAAALLVVVALLHCAMEPIVELGNGSGPTWTASTGETAPHQGCNNESGCICRGATLAHGVDVAALHPVLMNLLPVENYTAQASLVGADSAVAKGIFDDPCRLPPLSGRILRARHSSLVI